MSINKALVSLWSSAVIAGIGITGYNLITNSNYPITSLIADSQSKVPNEVEEDTKEEQASVAVSSDKENQPSLLSNEIPAAENSLLSQNSSHTEKLDTPTTQESEESNQISDSIKEPNSFNEQKEKLEVELNKTPEQDTTFEKQTKNIKVTEEQSSKKEDEKKKTPKKQKKDKVNAKGKGKNKKNKDAQNKDKKTKPTTKSPSFEIQNTSVSKNEESNKSFQNNTKQIEQSNSTAPTTSSQEKHTLSSPNEGSSKPKENKLESNSTETQKDSKLTSKSQEKSSSTTELLNTVLSLLKPSTTSTSSQEENPSQEPKSSFDGTMNLFASFLSSTSNKKENIQDQSNKVTTTQQGPKQTKLQQTEQQPEETVKEESTSQPSAQEEKSPKNLLSSFTKLFSIFSSFFTENKK